MYPASLPKNTRPEATVGWECISAAFGTPKAHFNFRFGICAAVKPAFAEVWNRVFLSPGLQPFHEGPAAGSVSGGLDRQGFVILLISPASSLPIGRAARNSAICRFWTSGIWAA